MTQDERDKELEGKPRVHICVWCKQILFEKPPGIPPTDEEASDIANHIMNCGENPLVQKVKRLEEEADRREKMFIKIANQKVELDLKLFHATAKIEELKKKEK